MPPDNKQSSEAQVAASIVSDFVQAWVDQVQHLYDGVRDADRVWDAEAVVHETSQAVDRMMPIAARGLTLTLDLLRPWSKAFQQRVTNA